jgi:hypothetical protein
MSIALLMEWVDARLQALRQNQNADGGWGYFPGRESRVEPTCYALRALPQSDSTWGKGIAFLLSRQDATGGLSPAPSVPGATWVTQLAFPLLKRASVPQKSLEVASEWILNTEGAEGGVMQRLLYSMGKSKVDQDPKLKGWPWRPDNNSWVEPTAHGLLALHWMKDIAPPAGIQFRRDMATRMLLDRRCQEGDWNYGNKKVLGEILPGYPETTGLALMGLAASGADLKLSLDRAAHHLAQSPGAYGRTLLTIALRLHGQSPTYTPSNADIHPSRNLMLAALEVLAGTESRGAFLP